MAHHQKCPKCGHVFNEQAELTVEACKARGHEVQTRGACLLCGNVYCHRCKANHWAKYHAPERPCYSR